MRASPTRVVERLDELYALGGGPGANRIGGSREEDEACALAEQWMDGAGLDVERDAVGNVVGRLRGERPELPEVWTGSHLDSVPAGGKYDGALGVVGGLEAVARAGRCERTLGVVVFRDEERGCNGSRARVARGELPGTYVELHVEQGPVLAGRDAPLGVVTGIVGYTRFERVFEGTAGHAGTTPMGARDDALCKAAEFVLRVREAASGRDGVVATVGTLTVEPGAVNVVPGLVRLTVDARSADGAALRELVAELGGPEDPDVAPVSLDAGVRSVLLDELGQRRLPAVELASGAGHDAGVLAAAGVQAGMLFVRSLNGGVSHSPEELSSGEDVELAIDVLAAALKRLAS